MAKSRYETQETVLEFIEGHPGCVRQEVYSKFCTEESKDERERHRNSVTDKIRTLLDKGLVRQDDSRLYPSAEYPLQKSGSQKREASRTTRETTAGTYQGLYLATPADSFFFHIPFLIHVGERFDENDLAERAGGFLGFYLSQGVSGEAARRDFLSKILQHLRNPALNSFIQQDDFKWRVVCSEEALRLWRLYSMIHTVLLKSDKSKIGFAVEFYDDLLKLLKERFEKVENDISGLSEKERYAALLMLNGVQLETLMPLERGRADGGAGLVSRLRGIGLPVVIHNQGKENESTLIESRRDSDLPSDRQ